MKNLLYKEFKLLMHPTTVIFLSLSAMLLIPNYPYMVTFFYTCLGLFFTTLSGRENNDIFYSMTLPIRKKDIVKARIVFFVIIQLVQMAIAIPFAIIRQSYNAPGNQVGINANIALFAFSFVMCGLFNWVFFGKYYSNPEKVGISFGLGSTMIFVYMGIVEGLTHIVPFFRDRLDTNDNQFVLEKVIALIIGIVIYIFLTCNVYKKSVRKFDKLDF